MLYSLGRRWGRFAEEGPTVDKGKAVVVDEPENPPPPSSLGSEG